MAACTVVVEEEAEGGSGVGVGTCCLNCLGLACPGTVFLFVVALLLIKAQCFKQ